MINSIQSLRAVAAIYVVVFHAARKLEVENAFTQAGEGGVDLFFIISGFVITYTTIKSDVDWKEFMLKRLVRIVPLYWVLTILFSTLLFFIPSAFQTYAFDLKKVILSLLFVPQLEKPVVYTGWTLIYEMYFYALFSLGLMFERVRATTFVVFFLMGSVILGVLNKLSDSPLYLLVTSPLLIEFVFGILLCYIFRSGFRLSPSQSLMFVLAGFLCFFLFEEADRVISYGVPWLLIFVGVVFNSKKLLDRGPLLFLGDASYSIYLVHVLSLPALHFVLNYIDIKSGSSSEILLLFYSLVGVLSGVACFVLIERPMLTRFKPE